MVIKKKIINIGNKNIKTKQIIKTIKTKEIYKWSII
jgi:hypothetical protein